MQITYLGPLDAVDVEGHLGVKIGDTVDVSDAIAGHAPSERYLQVHAELIEAHTEHDHPRKRALMEELTGFIAPDGTEVPPLDAGDGLLAQFWTWAPAAKAKATKTTAVAEEAKP